MRFLYDVNTMTGTIEILVLAKLESFVIIVEFALMKLYVFEFICAPKCCVLLLAFTFK